MVDNFYLRDNRGIFARFSTTYNLILANVIFFVAFFILSLFIPSAVNYLALNPASIVQGKNLWALLTSMFIHAGFFHLFFNMFSLFFIGVFVERIIGKKRLLWFYLISGIFAGLFFSIVSGFYGNTFIGEKIFGNPNVSGVGASGALFGLLGLLAVLVPYSKVFLILGPLIAIVIDSLSQQLLPITIANNISILVTIYIFISIFSVFSFNQTTRKLALPVEMPLWLLPIVAIVPLILIGLFVSLPIGNMAHLGGLIAGLIYGFYLRKKYKNKTKLISKYFGS